jgi:hypothetical protein
MPSIKALHMRGRVHIVGEVDVEAGVRPSPRRLPLPPMDDRRGVALIDDAIEGDIAQPPRRLAGDLGQPLPVLLGVLEVGAVRLLHRPLSHDERVEQPTPVGVL